MGVTSAREEGIRVEEHLGLVHAFARRYMGRGVEYDDLYGAGCVGLCKAAKAFEPERGYAFSTYAVPVIVGEMKRLFRDDGTVTVSRRLKELYLKAVAEEEQIRLETGREPRLSELAEVLQVDPEELALAFQAATPPLSLSAVAEDEGDKSPGETLDLPVASPEEALTERLSLEQAIESLEEQDRALIRLRYRAEMSQQRTAQLLGMTQVQVSRRERKLLRLLREKMT